jgi:hypothetical protein
MVLSPAPIAKPTAEERAARPLAYQQAIAERDAAEAEAAAKAKSKADETKDADIPPFETVTSEPPADAGADGSEDASAQDITSQDMASLPDESADAQDGFDEWPGEGADPSQDVAALPRGQAAPYDGVPPMPGAPDQGYTDDAEQWGDERRPPWAYGPPPGQGDPYAARRQPGDPYAPPPVQGDPYAQGDPYGPPQDEQLGGRESTEWADQNTEEWVEVVISGAAMRATASEDAPMLFAFPYGRNLKVVSRYEGWIEVTDPQSAATGWMQAHVVAPSGVNRRNLGQSEAYYDEEPRRGRRAGWLKRNGGGLGDMINRALGGN